MSSNDVILSATAPAVQTPSVAAHTTSGGAPAGFVALEGPIMLGSFPLGQRQGDKSLVDRYVASRLSSAEEYKGSPETFAACGAYVQNPVELVDGANVRPGTYLKVRKNQTFQSIGLKESYCPLCELIFSTAWSRLHLASKQHAFNVFISSTPSRVR